MTTNKKKTEIHNITLRRFQDMARDKAKSKGIDNIEELRCYFSLFSKKNADTGNSDEFQNFNIVIITPEGTFSGIGFLPAIAIDNAITQIEIVREKIRVNAQARLEPTQPGEELRKIKVKDGIIETGIRFYVELNKRFTDFSGMTVEELSQHIKNMMLI